MKIGDIKIEALKLMFANYSFDFGINDLPNMQGDENYGSYLVSMNGSINRGIDRIQNACVVALKSYTIKNSEFTKGQPFDRFDSSAIKDLYVIDRIVAVDSLGGYNGNADYILEGNNILLKNGYTYTVLYYPTLKTVDDNVGDADEIWLPSHIARLLPYYIKGDLYQEEEPSLAADARNLFEASLDDLKKPAQGNQTRIKQVLHY